MENVNRLSRLRHWWASHLPPVKRPSPMRFFIWLPLFAASCVAFSMLSPGWFQVGLLLMIAANIVLDGFWPRREKPAVKLTLRELLFLVAAAVLIIAAVFYFAVVNPSPTPAPSPLVARVTIAVLWVAVVAYQSRRTFASSTVRSA